MSQAISGGRPIGYWLKEVDRLIDTSVDRVLAGEELTRRHWQVLSTLAERPVSQVEIDAVLSPFLSADQPTTTPVVEDLLARGWVTRTGDGPASLTEVGAAHHHRLIRKIGTVRRVMTRDVTAEEYATVIDLLERMADNLAGVR
jgi:DNA-binding MarR family transcriptional regulator